MNKNFLLVVVLVLIVISIVYFERMRPDIPSGNGKVLEGDYAKAPELIGISGYINVEEGFKIEDVKGKVVLIDFWTYTCINCIRTLPFLKEWDRKYRDQGLVIVGVHTPEFGFEEKYENVKEAVDENGIEYAVVQDNDYKTWGAYRNRYWPHKFLIDSEGFIRYDHIGEGGYGETERVIQELLSEINDNVGSEISDIEDNTPRVRQTHELYAGYDFNLPRGQDIGNKGGLKPNQIINYELPSEIKKDVIYLDGKWKSNEDDLTGVGNVILDFTANSVNIVMDGDKAELDVMINDEYLTKEQAGDDVEFDDDRSFVLVDEPRLYNVFRGEYGNYLLRLSSSKEFSFNAFTFG